MRVERVIWPPYATRRLADRPELPRELVERTLLDPEQRFADASHAGREVAQRRHVRPDGTTALARVFFVDNGDGSATIVTFYLSTPVERYWRTDL
jgi:hypothetical protein